MRDNPGFDQIAQGMSGLMSVTGTPESGPTRMGIAICDLLGGIFAVQGILLALETRHRTGRGQKVETSLLESIVSVLSWSAGIYFETGKNPVPSGNHHPLVSPHGTFQAADRPFNISVGNPAMWKKFAALIGRPELETDDRFQGVRRRVKNRAALTAEVNTALAAHPAAYWIDELNQVEHGRVGIVAEPHEYSAQFVRLEAERFTDVGILEREVVDLGETQALVKVDRPLHVADTNVYVKKLGQHERYPL